MTTLELARELVKHPNFRWCSGMLAMDAVFPAGHRQYRVTKVLEDGYLACIEDNTEYPKMAGYNDSHPVDPLEVVPDLLDGATQGALLALLKEKTKNPFLYLKVAHGSKGIIWEVSSKNLNMMTQYGDYGCALAEILMAIPHANVKP